MQGFLFRDKDKFIEDAIRDALISLVQSLSLEEFNFNLGGYGSRRKLLENF